MSLSRDLPPAGTEMPMRVRASNSCSCCFHMPLSSALNGSIGLQVSGEIRKHPLPLASGFRAPDRRTRARFQRCRSLRLSSTTVTFSGAYLDAAQETKRRGQTRLAITWGHNKDHRPDLKHLLFILTVATLTLGPRIGRATRPRLDRRQGEDRACR